MKGVKCADCAEYRNEWCEKVVDSPYPEMIRDCQYYHEKDRDVVKVVRCKDCKSFRKDDKTTYCAPMGLEMQPDDYCSYGERKES